MVSDPDRAWLAADRLPRQYLLRPRHQGIRYGYCFRSTISVAPKWQRRNWQISTRCKFWSGLARTYLAYIASRRPSFSSHKPAFQKETVYGFGGFRSYKSWQRLYPYSAIASCSPPWLCNRSVRVGDIAVSPRCSPRGQTSRPAATASRNPSDFVAETSRLLSQYLPTVLDNITSADTAAIENTRWSCAMDCWPSTLSGRAT